MHDENLAHADYPSQFEIIFFCLF